MMISLSSPSVCFDTLDVHEVENNSGVFIGRNRQLYWQSTERSRSGFGGISGHNQHHSDSAHLVLKEDNTRQQVD
ncbi:hypothetical protein FZC79_20035 [Rossellomorea vietnamensis]|uniref:Uncharacterized protein n=2 Tax=Rossellomorea vietnamensis TaxID=218284 RepID=A0A5D4K7H4_9BACI|nr:hypothetical protein FZC79_20035 [Rossellomorea vietnamensis]